MANGQRKKTGRHMGRQLFQTKTVRARLTDE